MKLFLHLTGNPTGRCRHSFPHIALLYIQKTSSENIHILRHSFQCLPLQIEIIEVSTFIHCCCNIFISHDFLNGLNSVFRPTETWCERMAQDTTRELRNQHRLPSLTARLFLFFRIIRLHNPLNCTINGTWNMQHTGTGCKNEVRHAIINHLAKSLRHLEIILIQQSQGSYSNRNRRPPSAWTSYLW